MTRYNPGKWTEPPSRSYGPPAPPTEAEMLTEPMRVLHLASGRFGVQVAERGHRLGVQFDGEADVRWVAPSALADVPNKRWEQRYQKLRTAHQKAVKLKLASEKHQRECGWTTARMVDHLADNPHLLDLSCRALAAKLGAGRRTVDHARRILEEAG